MSYHTVDIDGVKIFYREANGAKLRPLFELGATQWQYSEGVRDPARHVSPDAWMLDQA